MIFLKHFHYCLPFGKYAFPKLLIGKKHQLEYHELCVVRFDDSIRYELPEEDMHDVNKLFGRSYGMHHNNSDRIGFRYVKDTDEVELVLYSYSDGKRLDTMPLLCAGINDTVHIQMDCVLTETGRDVHLYMTNETEHKIFDKTVNIRSKFNIFNHTKLSYSLTGYFGGNNRAPHKILISVK